MYEPSRQIMSFNIAGFQYWDGALLIGALKPGVALELVAEPDNPHDPEAVALYYQSKKLGYVPSDLNATLSVMCFYGHASAFEARILQVDHRVAPWKQVRVGIFVTDARKTGIE